MLIEIIIRYAIGILIGLGIGSIVLLYFYLNYLLAKKYDKHLFKTGDRVVIKDIEK
ncbi:MAG: hypothetical protein RLZZ601_2142, partial [Pseudomonadota bacterium]